MNVTTEVKSESLLARAAAWRLASLLLERPREGWYDAIEKLSAEVIDGELRACAKNAADHTEETYHRLFGPGGAVSPREVSYCGFEDPGWLMAELSAFYRAFSFEPRREEPIDHIAVESGFLGYLFLKEAYARTRGDYEAAEITKSARQRFVNEHLLRCAGGIRNRLNEGPRSRQKIFSWLVKNARAGR
jgi:nitrate reductase assembly molybdenum cofactor insertion protein NarJ